MTDWIFQLSENISCEIKFTAKPTVKELNMLLNYVRFAAQLLRGQEEDGRNS